ncbi:murein transglycosylase A [Candidatus Phycosocius spiralis]|uniref:peptidoglycan lytic exotransglycosylase n=1 Tax=Candidatus Phycosocius spiralis TaxID=2815099 RepID=A0ABQ4PUL7_9PROT|nr:MltA domain-containing protein [Candidatus Phycosocius spiralis]GIU66687.1 membrane protein [Candidatus Phycosocius spiralis]
MPKAAYALLAMLAVSACATVATPSNSIDSSKAQSGPPQILPEKQATPVEVKPPIRPRLPAPISALPVGPVPGAADLDPLTFSAASFETLPDWSTTDVAAARRAFLRSCTIMQQRPIQDMLSSAVAYSGRVGDWLQACSLAQDSSIDDRTFWENSFQAWRVETKSTQIGRLTGYYEPIMTVSWAKTPVYSEPIQARPSDLIEIDLGKFDPSLRNRTIVARLDKGMVVPYYSRAQITEATAPVLAWGEPAEVLSLQVQGSGRLQFQDGLQMRAAFAAHNGHRFGSNAQELIRRGILAPGGASMDAIKTWFKSADPKVAREVLNANPRTVFFKLEPIRDPSDGPKGAQQVPLEPGGSVAIDPTYHAYGVPIFLAADAPRVTLSADATLRRLVIAQDTGGAIKGPIRGDLYWGTGPEAGLSAGRINHDVRFWVLLPRGLTPSPLTVAPPS